MRCGKAREGRSKRTIKGDWRKEYLAGREVHNPLTKPPKALSPPSSLPLSSLSCSSLPLFLSPSSLRYKIRKVPLLLLSSSFSPSSFSCSLRSLPSSLFLSFPLFVSLFMYISTFHPFSSSYPCCCCYCPRTRTLSLSHKSHLLLPTHMYKLSAHTQVTHITQNSHLHPS